MMRRSGKVLWGWQNSRRFSNRETMKTADGEWFWEDAEKVLCMLLSSLSAASMTFYGQRVASLGFSANLPN